MLIIFDLFLYKLYHRNQLLTQKKNVKVSTGQKMKNVCRIIIFILYCELICKSNYNNNHNVYRLNSVWNVWKSIVLRKILKNMLRYVWYITVMIATKHL